MMGATAQDSPGRLLHVLVVDDHADCAASLALLVGLFGHEVEVTCDGTAALRAMTNWLPDVVLLDLGLPGNMDGWELARQIRRMAGEKRPLLIAVTGLGTAADRRRSWEAGIDLHLTKPVDAELLEQVLRRFRGSLCA